MLRLPSWAPAPFVARFLKWRRIDEESALMAICASATLCITAMVVLAICVSATVAVIYSISVAGLLLAVGLAVCLCGQYQKGLETKVAHVSSAPLRERMAGRRGGVSVEFACLSPLVLWCLASLVLFTGDVRLGAVAFCGTGILALLASFGLLSSIFRQREDNQRSSKDMTPLKARALDLKGERGSSAVELALIYPLVFICLGGLFGVGQALYSYNTLQSSMRSSARYGSLAPYDLPNGNNWKAAVRNMAVYGDPDPGPNATALVPGMTVANVNASAYIPAGEPTMVTVAVANYEFDLLFLKFDVSQPVVTFPFLGRALIP